MPGWSVDGSLYAGSTHAVSAHADGLAAGSPPPLTPLRLLTAWTWEPLPALALALGALLYLEGVRRVRARGDAWSPWRTAAFLGPGLGTAVLATQSTMATYDTTLLSVHMAQHMLLGMVAPLFLALGAPVTLALRTLPKPARGWLVSLLHSRFARVLAFPLVGGAFFVASPWLLYFSGWYTATLGNAWLHNAMHLHFVLAGSLFFWPLLGLDPVPGRLSYPLRMLVVFLTLPFHAFLGVAVMGSTTLIGGQWYSSLDRHWGPSLAGDQDIAGGILWSGGDLLGLLFFAVLFVQWLRASEREAVREDRRLDRLEARSGRVGAAGR